MQTGRAVNKRLPSSDTLAVAQRRKNPNAEGRGTSRTTQNGKRGLDGGADSKKRQTAMRTNE